MNSIGPDRWKLVASAGTGDDGRRRRITLTFDGTRAEATQALAELVATTTARRNAPEPETLLRLAMTMPDEDRAYLAARLLDTLK